ncbi:uncharacterized protein [Lolium perenne]|uniref:uncharacterized protein n=1 Tax=Lolium perenne TaxID=4522 RepID=UPI0021EA7C55|nr:uncharacterized protein LOC127327186 [Lolium perenne]
MADASKRIDLAAPLLSVRRHAGRRPGERDDDATLGGVPFGWERWPGCPKSVRTIIRRAPPLLPEPEEAARSSDALSRADSCYTVNCSVAGLSDAAGATVTVSPGVRGGSVMMDRFLLAAKEQCAFRKEKAGAANTRARDGDGDGDSLPRRAPVEHPPANYAQAQPTDTSEPGGGEDEGDAHSTAGFTSRRKCGLLPTRCAQILNPAHAVSRHGRGARRFLSDLGRSCQRETNPLLPQRRPEHDAGMVRSLCVSQRTWEEVHVSSLARLVRSDRACSLRQVATVASELDMTVRGLYNGQAGGVVHPKDTHLGLLLVLDRADGSAASSPLPPLKRGRLPSGGKTSIGHCLPPPLEEKAGENREATTVRARAQPPALLALPSPKMPTESWLSRTLPSVSNKPPTTSFLGIHVQQLRTKQQAPSPCRSSHQAKFVDHGARPRRVRIHDLQK